MSHDPHATPAPFNPEDPHHEHEHDHGHTIVSWKTLVIVLGILLTFTALTVSAANGEKWIASAFDVILPQWVNVAVAMSIATIKGVLVMMYFMQLKYDNPFNTIIMLFCFLAFALFLGFTALDLNSRTTIEPWKMGQISAGGTGMNGATPLVWQARVNVAERRNTLLRSNEAEWRQRLGNQRYDAELAELALILDRAGIEAYIAEHGLDHYFERLAYYDPRAKAHHDSHASHASTGSSAQRSRPRTGLSGALDTTTHHDDHSQDSHAASDHGHAADPLAEPTPTADPASTGTQPANPH